MDPTLANPVNRALASLLSAVPDPVCLPETDSGWDAVMKKAGAFGLLPYLAHVFQDTQRLNVPAHVVQAAEDACAWNTQILLRRMAVLRRLTKALEEQNIPVVLLKGMALAHLVYPSPECRQMSDVDLLVPHGKLPIVREIASNIGLIKSEAEQILENIGSALQNEPVCQLRTENGLVRIDIHDTIPSFQPFGYSLENVWNRSIFVHIRNQSIRVLHPIDFLSHISLHLAHHHCFTSRLVGCLDIRLFLESGFARTTDWTALILEAKANDSFRWLQLGLVVSQEILGFDLPSQLAHEFSEGLAKPRQMAIEQCFYSGRMPITTNFMHILAAPSLSNLLSWMRDNWKQHNDQRPTVRGPRPRLNPVKYAAAHVRRLGWLVSREGISITGWRTAIQATRSREQLARFAGSQHQIAGE